MKIGVFDSGFGGLTVLRELLPLLPQAEFLYLGDTARLPYGSKSRATIVRYALSSTRFLLDQGAEFLVIACNTASALALDAIEAAVTVPVLGVIEPGAAAAHASTATKNVLVIATEATVASRAYAAACQRRRLHGVEKACPLLVPLVEEGWIDHPVTAEVAKIYLTEVLKEAHDAGQNPDTLVLGCTHYPLLRPLLERTINELTGAGVVRVIDSAEATAAEAARQVQQLVRGDASALGHVPQIRCFATDSVEKFERLGSRFLGVPVGRVELVDLGG